MRNRARLLAVAVMTNMAISIAIAAGQVPSDPRLTFEVASIRPSGPAEVVAAPGARGGGTGGFGGIQIDPKRISISRITLYGLIAQAYRGELAVLTGDSPAAVSRRDNKDELNLLTGGPEWVNTERWDIQALLLDGSPAYTLNQFLEGNAPKLQKMLQALLAERFKLVLRRETKERQVYLLKVTTDGPKFDNGPFPKRPFMAYDVVGNLVEANADQMPRGYQIQLFSRLNGKPMGMFAATNQPMSALLDPLSSLAGRLVLDRTGIAGIVSFNIAWPSLVDSNGARVTPQPKLTGKELSKALEEVGLQLEEVKAPVEYWVIDRVERPSEN
jgi:uncharacterized protein (TIGR03435 family)